MCEGYTDRVVGLPERSPRVLHSFLLGFSEGRKTAVLVRSPE
jgi:hypothetical protein